MKRILNEGGDLLRFLFLPAIAAMNRMNFVVKRPQITENRSQACARSLGVLPSMEGQSDRALTLYEELIGTVKSLLGHPMYAESNPVTGTKS